MMNSWYDGLIHLGPLQILVVVLVCSHFSVLGVTLYLHRHQAHRAFDMHPAVAHFFRFWLWLSAGVNTREFVAMHRKHHATSDTENDPHSPHVIGHARLMWLGAIILKRQSSRVDVLERYGTGTPNDWMERHFYIPLRRLGLPTLALVDVFLFGIGTGLAVFALHVLWLPFWIWGFITSYGHYIGYRHFESADASRNVLPIGFVIGGEELHNNHHAHPTSARFSVRWYEFDAGWAWIRLLQMLSLVTVRRTAPVLRLGSNAVAVDERLLARVCTHRLELLARYCLAARSVLAAEFVREGFGPEPTALATRCAAQLGGNRDPRLRLHVGEFEKICGSSTALCDLKSRRDSLVLLWDDPALNSQEGARRLQSWIASALHSGWHEISVFASELCRIAPDDAVTAGIENTTAEESLSVALRRP